MTLSINSCKEVIPGYTEVAQVSQKKAAKEMKENLGENNPENITDCNNDHAVMCQLMLCLCCILVAAN